MYDQSVDYEAIRKRVDRKLKHERIWFLHLLICLLYLGIATTGAVPVNGIILIGWSALLFIHQIWVNSIGKREAAIEQEIRREQELQALALQDKPKRAGEFYTLGDDGELVNISDDYEDEKPKRHESGV